MRKTKGKSVVIFGFAEGDKDSYIDLIEKVLKQGFCLS
jgi:hypothetical protein